MGKGTGFVRVLFVSSALPNSREIVRSSCEYDGIGVEANAAEVTAVVSASEAFEIIAGKSSMRRPDILLSDIGMPFEDGYTLIRKIRMLPPAKGGRIPAVALTAYARDEDRTKAIEAGFQMHLAKLVAPEELVKVIAKLTGRLFST